MTVESFQRTTTSGYPNRGRGFRRSLSACLLAMLSGLLSFQSQAQTNSPPSDWQITIAPYAWLMGASGSLTAGSQKVDVNANFIDVLGKTDTVVAFMAYGEARKSPYGAYLDLIYTQVTASGGFATARNPLPQLSLAVNANGGVRSTLFIAELGGFYELYRGGEAGSRTVVDALFGIRYWHASNDLTFNVSGAFNAPGFRFDRNGNQVIFRSGDMDWADPVIGLRLRHEFAPHHELRLRGDIGGFGIGSQFSWQAFAGYGYEFSPGPTSWTAHIGYRALAVNYSAGSGTDVRGVDAVLHGPVLGVSARF